MAAIQSCFIPGFIIFPIILILNISMVVCIFKKNGIGRSPYLLLTANGFSNVFYTIQMIVETELKRSLPIYSEHIES